MLTVCAAPHLPAGILSPYSDGERGAIVDDFANCQRWRKEAGVEASHSLPVTIRGEMSGRTVRGSADGDSYDSGL
ncbi:MAG: hypothetical protein E5X51_03590 [Mesorhizobium sp.]|nr:MAG: hypothetical protein E5X51_03590 [Mesorhizobium sp.]